MMSAFASGWNVIVRKRTLEENSYNLRKLPAYPGTVRFAAFDGLTVYVNPVAGLPGHEPCAWRQTWRFGGCLRNSGGCASPPDAGARRGVNAQPDCRPWARTWCSH